MRLTITLAAVLGVFGMWACGGSTDGGAGAAGAGGAGGSAGAAGAAGSDGGAADQACADLVKARCERREACTNGFDNRASFGDEATCEAREELTCVANLAAPGTSATSADVEACTAALPGEACTDLLANDPPSACVPSAGAGATGAPCFGGAQCQSTYCAVPKGAACGTCEPEPKAGDSCAGTGECGRDLVCLREKQVCAASGASGAACGRELPCAAGLSCVGATKDAAGKCESAGTTVGAACDPKQQTAPGCERTLGLYCPPATKACQAIALAADGQPCGVVSGAEIGCEAGGQCVLAAGSEAGTCKAPAADGAACDIAEGPPCLAPARCVVTGDAGTSGTCTLPDATACH